MTTILRQTGLRYQTSKSATKISHLFYMDDLKLYGTSSDELESLLNRVRIFSTDISMEIGLERCATLTIHKGKAQHPQSDIDSYTFCEELGEEDSCRSD